MHFIRRINNMHMQRGIDLEGEDAIPSAVVTPIDKPSTRGRSKSRQGKLKMDKDYASGSDTNHDECDGVDDESDGGHNRELKERFIEDTSSSESDASSDDEQAVAAVGEEVCKRKQNQKKRRNRGNMDHQEPRKDTKKQKRGLPKEKKCCSPNTNTSKAVSRTLQDGAKVGRKHDVSKSTYSQEPGRVQKSGRKADDGTQKTGTRKPVGTKPKSSQKPNDAVPKKDAVLKSCAKPDDAVALKSAAKLKDAAQEKKLCRHKGPLEECGLPECLEHWTLLKEEGRYVEYNEKRYLGYQIQEGMGCVICFVNYKVGEKSFGTYEIGKDNPIIMCHNMHMRKTCNGRSCDMSFCGECWKKESEKYAENMKLTGSIGGRRLRRKKINV